METNSEGHAAYALVTVLGENKESGSDAGQHRREPKSVHCEMMSC